MRGIFFTKIVFLLHVPHVEKYKKMLKNAKKNIEKCCCHWNG